MQTNLFYGCTLASWVDGRYVHPDVTFQGNSGSGWTTIASDEYDVHSALGTITQRTHDSDDNAVDWVAYQEYQDAGNTAFRCSYSVYNPSTNTATAYTNETQTVNYLTFGAALGSEITGRLTLTTAPYGQFLVGDYLSLGTVGTRPKDKNTGTGIWGDATGLYGLNASTQEVVFSAATGKITAGAGAVTLDANGITITADATEYIQWLSSGTKTASIRSDVTGGGAPLTGSYYYNYGIAAYPDSQLILSSRNFAADVTVTSYLDTHSKWWRTVVVDSGASKTGNFYITSDYFSYTASSPSSSLEWQTGVLTLTAAAPTILLADNTASAKDLQIVVDGNKATFEEAGGTDMLVMDLANARIGIGTASPTSGYKLETSESILVNSSTNNSGFVAIFTGSSSASVGPQNSFITNDGAAVVANDRIGTFLFNGYDGTAEVLSAAIIARATETWATTTNRGSQIDFLATPNGSVTIATPMILSATTLTLANAVNIAVNTSTGTKIGTGTTQKLSFWNATPIVQPTTSYGAASFTANAGTAVNDASTFDGYTLKQVVSALRGTGLLA